MQEGICAHVRTLVAIFTPSQSFFAHIHGGIYFTERRISRDTCLERIRETYICLGRL